MTFRSRDSMRPFQGLGLEVSTHVLGNDLISWDGDLTCKLSNVCFNNGFWDYTIVDINCYRSNSFVAAMKFRRKMGQEKPKGKMVQTIVYDEYKLQCRFSEL